MKLTTKQLKQIIKEELNAIVESSAHSFYHEDPSEHIDASFEDLKRLAIEASGGGELSIYAWEWKWPHTKDYFKHIKPIEMRWIHIVRNMDQQSRTASLSQNKTDFLKRIGIGLVNYYEWAGTGVKKTRDGSMTVYPDPNMFPTTYSQEDLEPYSIPDFKYKRWQINYPFGEARKTILKYLKRYFPNEKWDKKFSDHWIRKDKHRETPEHLNEIVTD